MFLVLYKNENDEQVTELYNGDSNGWNKYFRDTFNPLCQQLALINFKVKGETYTKRKDSLRDLAIEYQWLFSELTLSWSELFSIENFFYKNARRYGLVREFHENGIC